MLGGPSIPVATGLHYEFEAGGMFCKDFVFTHTSMALMRVYIVWQPQASCWLMHINDRHEFVLIRSFGALQGVLNQAMDSGLPIWWWAEGSAYVNFAIPPEATGPGDREAPDVAPR